MRHGYLCALVVLAMVCGCGEGEYEAEDSVPLGQVPPAALKAAEKRAPDVKFESAWKGEYGGKVLYEIRGKTKEGKIREIEVTASGEVVREE